MSVTLRKKINPNGSTSLYLDIYHNGNRYKEYLKGMKLVKPANPIDRKTNSEILNTAKEIAVKRASEIVSNDYNIIATHKSKVDFIKYFEDYIANYKKKDKKNMQGAFNQFKMFMANNGIQNVSMKTLNDKMVFDFAEFLKEKCFGEGAASYFARFKKVLKYAVRDKVILSSPAMDITIARDESIKKDILTFDEIRKLATIQVTNDEVKRAFLFSCFTGLRWVDIIALQWKHIDLENNKLKIVQSKTGVKVENELHISALTFLPEKGNRDEFVFCLPSHNGALKTLKNWVKKADIDKHITWHCARHSFATNLIYFKNDVTIVSKLLGHTSLKYTQRYTHIAEDLKKEAINSMPVL